VNPESEFSAKSSESRFLALVKTTDRARNDTVFFIGVGRPRKDSVCFFGRKFVEPRRYDSRLNFCKQIYFFDSSSRTLYLSSWDEG
jgi:hypothetical protein